MGNDGKKTDVNISEFERLEDINVGDEMTVLVKKGRQNAPIGRLMDGRVILFAKDTPEKIDPGDTVIGKVAHVTKTYIIVNPESTMGDTDEALLANLKNVASSGYYQHAVLAKALLRLLEPVLTG